MSELHEQIVHLDEFTTDIIARATDFEADYIQYLEDTGKTEGYEQDKYSWFQAYIYYYMNGRIKI